VSEIERLTKAEEAIQTANPYMRDKEECSVIDPCEWSEDPAVRRAIGLPIQPHASDEGERANVEAVKRMRDDE
jgi:hypothetical protein